MNFFQKISYFQNLMFLCVYQPLQFINKLIQNLMKSTNSGLPQPSSPRVTTNSKLLFNQYLLNNSTYYIHRISENISPLEIKITKKVEVESGYQCSILDYGSHIRLISMDKNENENEGSPKTIISFGPVEFSHNLKKMNKIDFKFFRIEVILNKTEKYKGECQVLQPEIDEQKKNLILFFVLEENCSFRIEYSLKSLKQNFLQLITPDPCEEKLLKLSLQDNRDKFMEFLSELKISCHFGNCLKVYFENQFELNMLLLQILRIIENPIIQSLNERSQTNSGRSSPTDGENDHSPNKDILKLLNEEYGYSEHSPAFHEKMREVKESYKKIEEENRRLKEENMNLKKQFYKSMPPETQQEKIKQIQQNLKKVTQRIDVLESQKNKKSKGQNANKEQGKVLVNSSKQQQTLLTANKKEKTQLQDQANTKESAKITENMKIMSPTPKYFKTESSEQAIQETKGKESPKQQANPPKKQVQVSKKN